MAFLEGHENLGDIVEQSARGTRRPNLPLGVVKSYMDTDETQDTERGQRGFDRVPAVREALEARREGE